jgi:hypothetical protein
MSHKPALGLLALKGEWRCLEFGCRAKPPPNLADGEGLLRLRRRRRESGFAILTFDIAKPYYLSATLHRIPTTGGRGGIRTLGGFNTTAAFQATALNRYATRPKTKIRPQVRGEGVVQ